MRAGSTFGIKIIEESRANMQGRTHTADTRAKISAANQGANNPRYGVSAVNATPIFVYNADTNKLIANYSGMREAAKQLKMSHHTIGKYLNSGKAYKAPIFR